MKKYYFIPFIFLLFIINTFAQNNTPAFTCGTANPACAGNGFSYPNVALPSTVTAEAGINYGCLNTQPRPTWFYFQIATSGPMSFHMAQGTTVGQTNLDVDYICWGPFSAPTCGPTGLNGHIAVQQNGTNACSYSGAATEDFTLNAVANQYYMLMITNFAGGTGFITLTQTNNGVAGAGTTNCDLLCPLSITGGNTSTCANTSLTANYLNSVINPTGPTTTFSWTYLCPGCTTPPVAISGSAPVATLLPAPKGTKSNLSQPLPAGTYGVTATSPGCLNPIPATTIIYPPIPPPINQPINLFACTGTTFDLTSNTSVVLSGLVGSFAVKYHHTEGEAIDIEPFIGDPSSPPVQNPTQYVGLPGEIIWMSIKNTGTGCSTTASFVLNYNSCAFQATNSGPICEGGTFNLAADAGAGYTYIWSGPNGFNSTLQNPTNIPTPTIPPFTYTCIATNGTITSNSSTTVSVKPKPVVISTLIQTNTPADVQTICSGGSTDFSLSSSPAGATFDWTVVKNNVNDAIDGNGLTIVQPLVNPSTSLGTAIYTVIPTLDGCSGNSKAITVTVNQVPVAIATPITATICSGDTTNIGLSSTPSGATFVWTVAQTVSGATFSLPSSTLTTIAQVLTNAGTVSGTADYAITPTLNTCVGLPTHSIITVNPLTVISTSPIATQTICSGIAPTNLSVIATGTGSLSYQWYSNPTSTTTAGTLIASATAATFTPSNATVGTLYYYCVVTGTCGTATSTVSEVIVTPLTVISANPIATQTICNNSPATILSVTATGTSPVSYQWYSNTTNATTGGTLIATATASTFTPSNAIVGTVYYYCVVTGNCGTATSTVSEVNVTPLTVIIINPIATQTICNNSPATNLSISAAGTGTLSYQWYSNTTSSTTGGTLIASATSTTFTPSNSTVTTVYYYCIATGTCGTATSTVSEVIVTPLTVISANPIATQTICNNSPATTLSVAATGTATLTYQWYSNTTSSTTGGTLIAPATSTTFTPSNSTVTTVYYYCIATGTCGTATSTISEVVINSLTVITINPIATQTICYNSPATTLSVAATGTATLTYQWYSNTTSSTTGGTLIAPATSTTFTPSNSTVTTVYYYCIATGTCGTATSTVSEVIVTPLTLISTNPITTQTICNNSPATTLSVAATGTGTLTYQWYSNTTSSTTGGTLIASETSTTFTPSNSTASTFYYYCIATGTCGTATSTVSEVIVTPLTVISINPIATQTICNNSPATTLSVVASGTSTLTYQWYSNSLPTTTGGTLIASATSSTFIPSNSTVSTVYYYCIATGTCGTATSTVSEVIINPLTVITTNPIITQTICSGITPTDLSVVATGMGALTYQWYSNITNSAIGGSLINSPTNSIFIPLNTVGTVFYYCKVTGSCGTVTSTISEVIINPIPVATTPLPSTICSTNNTNIILASSGTGVIYNWTASGTDIIGFGDGNSTNNPIVQNLTTTGINPGTAVYTITPSIGSCIGNLVTTTVTVNPLPTVVMTGTTTICFNGTASVDFIGTPNAIVTYTINRGPNLTVTLLASGAVSLPTGNLTTDTRYDLVNVVSSGMPQCTQIQSGEVVITVVPIPLVIIRVGTSTVCSGSTTQISLDSNVTGANLNWTISNQSGISGANSGNGALISDVLTTTGNVSGFVNYEITANSGSCFGPSSNVTINVNPIPDVIASTNLQTFCSGGSTNVALSSSIAGTTYSWNVISSLVSGALGGSGSLINNTLFANGNSTGTVDYLISPLSNGCSGTPINVSVHVNPYPSAFANVALATICSGTTTNIALSSNVAATTFDWFSTQTSSPAQITGNSNGTVSLISDLLTTIGYIQGEVTYSITPTYSTCIGSPISVLIKVNPRPVVFPSTTSAVVCSGDAPNFILSPGFSNTTFSWTVSQTAVTGALAGSGTIIDNVLHAGSFVGTAVYTVTPSSNSCLGSPVVITVNVNPLPLPQIIDGNICVNLVTNAVSPYILETHLSDNLYDFTWTYNGQSVFGANSTLVASLAGIYSVVATNVNTNCKSLPTPAVVTESNPGMAFTTTQTLAFSDNAIITITVDPVSGVNVYQYSLDYGPYQLDNFFENVTPGLHTITVTDINGCTNLTKTLYIIDYPTYFTPNGDGIHDTWNIFGLDASAKIFIFDKNGKLIKQISPTTVGWDGTYNGTQLPSTDYWFSVEYTEFSVNKFFKSHFSLKR